MSIKDIVIKKIIVSLEELYSGIKKISDVIQSNSATAE